MAPTSQRQPLIYPSLALLVGLTLGFLLARNSNPTNCLLDFSGATASSSSSVENLRGLNVDSAATPPTCAPLPYTPQPCQPAPDRACPPSDCSEAIADRRAQALAAAPFSFPQLYGCVKPAPATLPDSLESSTSQSGEDRVVYKHMLLPLGAAAMGRTFLEIGAVDGLKYSNTARLERALDLRGILVEAHPLNTLRLRANQKNRPNAAIFTGAVCGLKQRAPGGSQRYEPGTVQFSPNADLVGTAIDQSSPSFLKRWHDGKLQGGNNVSCVPLQLLIEATGLQDIDFFSLDVEGAELHVLNTIDFDVTNVGIFVIEADNHDPQKNEAVRALLRSKGFVPAPFDMREGCAGLAEWQCMPNDAFVHPKFEERRAARGPPPRYHPGTGVRCDERLVLTGTDMEPL